MAGSTLELAVPLTALGARAGALLSFAVTVERRAPAGPIAIERHPDGHPIELRTPGPEFDAAHWRA